MTKSVGLEKQENKRSAGASRLALTAALGGALLLSAPAFAQAAPDDANGDDIVVVTGATTPVEYEKIGNSLTVVSKKLIEDQGYTYVPDVLRQVPGLAVNQGGSPGSLTQVRIRGAEGNHTLVLLDGIDVSSPDQGETDFSTLLSGDLQRIEVLRGPQSGLYGSNALAGVINLITRRDVNGYYYNGSAEGGSEGTFNGQASAGWGDGQSYVSGGVQGLTSEGYDYSPDTAAQGVPAVGTLGRRGDKEGNKIGTVYLRGGWAATPMFRLDGIARYFNKDSDSDGQAFNFPIAGKTYDDASFTKARQLLVGGSGTLSLMDGKWITVGSASYVDEHRKGAGTSFPFLTGPALPTAAQLAAVTLDPSGTDATRRKFALESTYQFGGPDFVNYLTGFVENKKETFQNTCPSFCSPQQKPEFSRELTGVGVQYRAEIARQLYLSGTARHDDNDKFDDDDTYSVSASWVIPNTGTRPHASWGTGVTNPTFTEQFGFDPGTFVGNPNLKPETADGWDIGVEQTLHGGRVILDLTYFESTLKHEIFTAFGPPPAFLSTPQNRTTDSDRNGWEFTARVHPISDVDVIASYTHLHATEPGGIEVRRPKDQAGLDASWRVSGGPFQVNLGVTYNGKQVDTDFGTFLRTDMDPYTLVRLGASYRLTDDIEIFGRIENLTDETYQEVIGYLGQPRAGYIGIRFRGGTAK